MFGYKCQECGKGIVRAKTFNNYVTRIFGYPFVIESAVIGICDACGEEHYSSKETKRWKDTFLAQLDEKRLFLKPQEITQLRTRMNIGKEQFALLTGCTRQSLHAWENPKRSRPQSRMADLIFKLLEHSLNSDKTDVLSFLREEASRLGLQIQAERATFHGTSLVLSVRRAASYVKEETHEMPLAAAPEDTELMVVGESGIFGFLRYDFETATLYIEFIRKVPQMHSATAEIVGIDGRVLNVVEVERHHSRLVLMKSTQVMPRTVSEIRLTRIT